MEIWGCGGFNMVRVAGFEYVVHLRHSKTRYLFVVYQGLSRIMIRECVHKDNIHISPLEDQHRYHSDFNLQQAAKPNLVCTGCSNRALSSILDRSHEASTTRRHIRKPRSSKLCRSEQFRIEIENDKGFQTSIKKNQETSENQI